MAATIAFNIAKVRQRIADAEKKSARQPGEVGLIAVSKTRPAQQLRAAAAAGITDFGENYLQEALAKIEDLSDLSLNWHFIGPIQSNKTRAIAEHFDWVHSVDRIKIARRLSEQRPAEQAPLNICLQINISAEASKSGFTADTVVSAAAEIAALPGIKLRGLMVIPQATRNIEQQHQAFASTRKLFEQLQQQHPALDTLSMGMSADMEAAIAEGATLVRIGTDLFGPRG